jgi:PAS domain S-box-containing protein
LGVSHSAAPTAIPPTSPVAAPPAVPPPAAAGGERRPAGGASPLSRTELALTAASGVLYDHDVITDRVERSGAFEQLTGYRVDEVPPTGKWWCEQVHPEDLVRLEEFSALANSSAMESMGIEYRIRHRDGTWRCVFDQAMLVRDATGRITRVVGYSVDITGLRANERRLERQSHRLRALADAAMAVTVAAQVHAVADMAAEGLLAVTDADRVQIALLAHGGEGEAYRVVVGTGIGRGAPLRIRLNSLDGTCHGECNLWRDSGEFGADERSAAVQLAQVAAVTIGNLRLMEALQDADRRKDRFLAILAHELRNPLAPIVHAGALLDKVVAPSHFVEKARTLIRRQSTQLVRLLDDLMDVGRITQDRLVLRCEPLDLRDLCAAALDTVRPRMIERRLDLMQRVPHTVVPVHGDRVRLLQVVVNLLNNAVTHTPSGGCITVEVELREHAVDVHVSDTGPGIPPAALGRIFEMFERAPRESLEDPGGLGIGLALSRRLARLHDGELTAAGRGRTGGATFTVHLPLSDVFPPATPDSTPTRPTAGMSTLRPTHHVLVVDDNVDAADSLALLLEREGHRVDVAYDGREAVQRYEQGHHDAVVMDIGLPLLDGYDAARAMRAAQGDRALLLVALTGWGQAEDRKRSEAAGFDHHLVKPVLPSEIQTLLAGTAAQPDGLA